MSVTWSFYMERYCGFLKRALRSKRNPWQNLDEIVKHFAQLAQLRVKYDLDDELLTTAHQEMNVSSAEQVFEECTFSLDARILF